MTGLGGYRTVSAYCLGKSKKAHEVWANMMCRLVSATVDETYRVQSLGALGSLPSSLRLPLSAWAAGRRVQRLPFLSASVV